MTIDFTCQKCEGSFELEAEDLIEGTEKLICPHCDNKASPTTVDDFASALTELRTQVAALSKKFSVSLSIESEEIEDELEDDEIDEDEESDEDELDFDDDDDSDDDDDYEDEDEFDER